MIEYIIYTIENILYTCKNKNIRHAKNQHITHATNQQRKAKNK